MLKELKKAILTEVKEDVTATVHGTHEDVAWVLVPSTPYKEIDFLKSCVNDLCR